MNSFVSFIFYFLLSPLVSFAGTHWSKNPYFSETMVKSTCTISYSSGGSTVYRRFINGLTTQTSTDGGNSWSTASSISGFHTASNRTHNSLSATGKFINPTCAILDNGDLYLMYEQRWEYFNGSTLDHVESAFYAATASTSSPTSFTTITGGGSSFLDSVFESGSGDGDILWGPTIVDEGSGNVGLLYVTNPSGTPTLRSTSSSDYGETYSSGSSVSISGNLETGVPFSSGTLITNPEAYLDGSTYHVFFVSPNNAGSSYQGLRIYHASGSISSLSIDQGAIFEPNTSTDCVDMPDITPDSYGGHLMFYGHTLSSACGGTLFQRKMAASYEDVTFTAATSTVDLSTVGGSSFGNIWSIPVWDGSHVVISSEGGGYIRTAEFDEDLNYVTSSLNNLISASDVNSSTDCQNPDGDGDDDEGEISDHKHIFQNGHHYIAFSNTGAGCLKVMEFDTSYSSTYEADVQVGVTSTYGGSDDPTNDMLLTGDGSNVFVGQFDPGSGHTIYEYDASLSSGGSYSIGGTQPHSNGAAACYVDGVFSLLAPESLALGTSNHLYTQQFDGSWSAIGNRHGAFYNSSGLIGISSALTWYEDARVFIGHYVQNYNSSTGGGDVKRVIFDRYMRIVVFPTTLYTSTSTQLYHRPHTMIENDRLFLGYDKEASGFTPYVTYFDLSI